tara:strand:+ start:185 stop:805 length:621 start_codon:yes stop_codon:yes gene_type:complete
MLIQAQVGPAVSSTSLGAGTNPNLRLDNLGGLTGTQLLPRYYEMTYRRQTYTIANQSGVTTSAALTTTYVGLCIANPTTSTINTVITKVGYAFTVAPVAAMVVGIMTGVGASITSAVTPRNRFVGGVSSQTLASTSLTLPGTPVLETIIGEVTTAAITTAPSGPGNIIDLEGSLILPPGAFACFYTSTASGASGFFGSFQFTEVPL